MKKFIISMAIGLTLGVVMPKELNAATAESPVQTTQKKTAKKSGAKHSAASKKYVPASIGDCYIGERMAYQAEPENIELMLNPDGTCEWKVNGKLVGKGTFTGTVTGKKYVVKVDVPNVGKYTFKGTKDEWNMYDRYEIIILNLEN